MLQIQCPYCGLRAETEFHCGGEGHILRPDDPSSVDDATWAKYLYYRDNPKGVHFERWVHQYGCGRWFNVARDTVTHKILFTYEMTEPKPSLDGSAE